jgi:hypothetical protein
MIAICLSAVVQAGLYLLLLRIIRTRRVLLRCIGVCSAAFVCMFLIDLSWEEVLPMVCRVAEPALVRPRRPLPEKNTWKRECTAQGYEIEHFVDTPPDGALAGSGQVWVRNLQNGRIGFMIDAACHVEETGFRHSELLVSRFYATIQGQSIFVKTNNRRDPEQWWFSGSTSGKPIQIVRPNMTDDPWPILSDDGKWVAWVSPTTPGKQQVVLQNMRTSETATISSPHFASDRLRLMAYNAARSELLIARQNWEQALVVSSIDGRLIWGPVEFGNGDQKEGVISQLLRREDGWLCWYSRGRPRIVQWSLHGIQNKYEVPQGTEINSVDVSPDGTLIAVGTDGDFAGSLTESTACVLRADTGVEVFRKYFPRRSWVQVAFIGNDRFAYSANTSAFLVPGAELSVLRINP